jgi:L-cysteine/cystine lyase
VTDPTAFRAEFPLFGKVGYLNAGSDGPVPRRAAEAARERIAIELAEGRGSMQAFRHLLESTEELRARYAGLLGCDPGETAITRSTTDGVNVVLAGLDLQPGDEIVTSDEEHPGLLAPLGAARKRRGVEVRTVPWDEVPGAVGPRTRLVACSHVSWESGRVVDAQALAATGVPFLLDGAQGLGAVPVDVRAMGCDFYAASGQKWLCGPDGTGALYVRKERIADVAAPWPSFVALSDPLHALDLPLRETAARYDLGILAAGQSAWALGALDVFEAAGWSWVHERAAALAADLASRLAERGVEVSERGRSTLVSWRTGDPAALVERLGQEGLVLRNIPGTDRIRASVGAWNSEEEIDRVVALAA